MTTTMMQFQVDAAQFDPLGGRHSIYLNLLLTLPAQLRDKLKEVEFGYLNPPDTPEVVSDAQAVTEAELKRLIHTGQVVAVNEKGEVLKATSYEPPETVVGEGGSYGYLIRFGGDQNMFIPRTPAQDIDVWTLKLSDDEMALVCMNIR